jgi:predicted transcriptional regulator
MKKINDETMLQMIDDGSTQKEIAAHFGVSPAAVCKRLKKYPPLPKTVINLTDKEQRFAIEMANGSTQTKAALASYECGSMDSAKNIGSKLMKRSDIKTCVAEIMQAEGLTRTHRVRKLKQHVDNRDPNVSLKALDQTFRLDGAYNDIHIINVGPSPVEIYHNLTDRINEIRKMLGEDVIDAEFEEAD